MATENGIAPGPRVGVLVGGGFQELEFWYPVLRLREEGVEVVVIGPGSEAQVTSQLGYPVIPELAMDVAASTSLSALVIPGGAMARRLLTDAAAMRLVAAAASAGAVMAALSEGVQLLAVAGLLNGRRVACPASLAGTVREAGGEVATEAVSVQDGVTTARSTDDLPAFFRALMGALAQQPNRVAA
ncbi:DJ-1/PfpI family protein [Roseomonas chloroacetimidivorans]|uniref:DJ-1/PfpI family protein n=1 Tax=Roseomonas chloroacetimidivorans TaxID=1766656 RepID=UPI003C7116BF